MEGRRTMKEKREIISQVAEFLSYKIRSGAVSSEGGDRIWKVALKHPEKADVITDILDMDLPEEETVAKIEGLV